MKILNKMQLRPKYHKKISGSTINEKTYSSHLKVKQLKLKKCQTWK